MILAGVSAVRAGDDGQEIKTLLPRIDGWGLSEAAESYLPANLFEYINGAAEIYLSYDFEELIVGQFMKPDTDANASVEIYDMGSSVNAFGIYGAERFPENVFLPVGTQGYLEDALLLLPHMGHILSPTWKSCGNSETSGSFPQNQDTPL